MRNKLMLLAAGALTALAFAALPAGASAEEMEAHCSAAPCVSTVESTGHAVLSQAGSILSVTCAKTTGTVTQTAATSTTVSVVLTFDECNNGCQNEGAGTAKIVTNTMTGHLITVTKGNPATAGILLTGINVTFSCAFGVEKTVTGNIIGTFENTATMCGKAVSDHTIEFAQTGVGQQTDKTYTGGTFDLTSGSHASDGNTASQTGTAHIKHGAKTVTITC
jgi:hypothetical protein